MLEFTTEETPTSSVVDPTVNPYLATDDKGNSLHFPIPEGKQLTAVMPSNSDEERKAISKEVRLIQAAARHFGYTARVRRLRVEGDAGSTKITVRTTKMIRRK